MQLRMVAAGVAAGPNRAALQGLQLPRSCTPAAMGVLADPAAMV